MHCHWYKFAASCSVVCTIKNLILENWQEDKFSELICNNHDTLNLSEGGTFVIEEFSVSWKSNASNLCLKENSAFSFIKVNFPVFLFTVTSCLNPHDHWSLLKAEMRMLAQIAIGTGMIRNRDEGYLCLNRCAFHSLIHSFPCVGQSRKFITFKTLPSWAWRSL